MAERGRHMRASQCTGKAGFESARLAHEVQAKRKASSRRRGTKTVRRDVYKCGWCGQWHLGR